MEEMTPFIRNFNQFKNYILVQFGYYPQEYLEFFWRLKIEYFLFHYVGTPNQYDNLNMQLNNTYAFWKNNVKNRKEN